MTIKLCEIRNKIRRKIHKKILPEDIRANQERKLYKKLEAIVGELNNIAALLPPDEWEEAYDRYFINDYISKHCDDIKGNVLEFSGGGGSICQEIWEC